MLNQYRVKHMEFPARLESAREAVLVAENDLKQATSNLKDALSSATGDALMDAPAESTSNETKRKAVINKAVLGCPMVKVAKDMITAATLKLASAESSLELVRDQRRAVEAAQHAAVKIADIYQIGGAW